MKDITILHTADWHSDEKYEKKLSESLDQMLNYCRENKVNYFVHSGDIFECVQQFRDESGVRIVHHYLREFSKLVDYIVIVKGNNHHDAPGSISLLHKLEPNILAYEYPAVIGFFNERDEKTYYDLLRLNNLDDIKLEPEIIIDLMPYPTKASLIVDSSIDLNNQNFAEAFNGLMNVFGIVNSKFNCPKVFNGHMHVDGARISTGQTLYGQDIRISPSSLKLAKADYYGLGHIHLYQEIEDNIRYAGCPFNKSWGETEEKSFNIIKFEAGCNKPIIERIMLKSSRAMVTVLAEFVDGKLVRTDNIDVPKGAEVRVKYKIKEAEQKLIDAEKENEFISQFDLAEVKFAREVLPTQRESRSQTIMDCGDLIAEVKEWGKVVDADIFNEKGEIKSTVLKKINHIQCAGFEAGK